MKRQMIRRIGCALLALAMLALPCFAAPLHPDAVLYRTKETAADGLIYEALYAEQDGQHLEGHLYTYTPGASVLPIVSVGNDIWGRSTVSDIAAVLSRAGYPVAGGMNGDFFSMATGIPLGVMLENGRILTTDAGENAFGIAADGTYRIGNPGIRCTMQEKDLVNAPVLTVSHINKNPSVWGAYLLTPDFAKTTHSTESCTEYVFRVPSPAEESAKPGEATAAPSSRPDFRIGQPLDAVLSDIRTETKNSEIPQDGFVLSVHPQYKNAEDFSSLQKGQHFRFTCTAKDEWNNVTFAVGGGDTLVRDGAVCKDIQDESNEKTLNPRTAVGYRADGTMLLFAVDGRSPKSAGMTLDELAETMQSLGCIGAVNLDGGGSTTVILRRLGEDGRAMMQTANRPSEGSQRRVSNAILFLNTAEPDGIPYAAELTPGSPILYRDSAVPLSFTVYDRSHTPVELDNYDVRVQWKAAAGTVDDTGRFTPPSGTTGGRVTVSAEITLTPKPEKNTVVSVPVSKTFTASTAVTITDTLDAIRAETPVLTVPHGGTIGPIAVSGVWLGHSVWIDPAHIKAAFADTSEEELLYMEQSHPHAAAVCKDGVLDLSWNLTAVSPDAAFTERTLRFTLEGTTRTYETEVTVRFGADPEIVMDMEGTDFRSRFLTDSEGVLRRVSGQGVNGSAALSVRAKHLGMMQTPKASSPVRRIDLFVKGELPASLSAVITADGVSHTIPWQVSDDFTRITGWKRISLDLTALDDAEARSFTIDRLFVSDTVFSLTFDNLTYHFGDDRPVFTDIGGSWAENDILTIYRMGVASGVPNADGTVSFRPADSLTRGAFAKMIGVFAGLPIPSIDEIVTYEEVPLRKAPEAVPSDPETESAPGDASAPETDPAPLPESPAPETQEPPAEPVPETETVRVVHLPFADAASIPEWALPYVKAVTDAGLMKGKGSTAPDGTPVTAFAADAFMTRAEVFQVLGALLGKETPPAPDKADPRPEPVPGTPAQPEPSAPPTAPAAPVFADDKDIPAWARENIERLAGAGLIAGFSDNTIKPLAVITRAELAALLVRLHPALS